MSEKKKVSGRRRILRIVCIVLIVLVALVVAGFVVRRVMRNSPDAMGNPVRRGGSATVEAVTQTLSAEAESGRIDNILVGAGTLAEQEAEEVTLPDSVELESCPVSSASETPVPRDSRMPTATSRAQITRITHSTLIQNLPRLPRPEGPLPLYALYSMASATLPDFRNQINSVPKWVRFIFVGFSACRGFILWYPDLYEFWAACGGASLQSLRDLRDEGIFRFNYGSFPCGKRPAEKGALRDRLQVSLPCKGFGPI